ncbi:GIY-YIG nuclease family protein [Roseovarius marisflavi]|uniref:GIY-YIG nuclease family protein n=1 Tax=Roseovarius marisflavi TaxID=1054996 RepID=UPI00111472BC
MPDLCKVGMTTRTPEARAAELHDIWAIMSLARSIIGLSYSSRTSPVLVDAARVKQIAFLPFADHVSKVRCR